MTSPNIPASAYGTEAAATSPVTLKELAKQSRSGG
jgi:hypothetical protein